MEEVEIPESLREFLRPEFPFPFTGPVEERNQGEIRASLEAEWRPEAARQRTPTVATVAALLQLRTLPDFQPTCSSISSDYLQIP